MATKKINFAVNQLIVSEETPFDIQTFNAIPESYTDTVEIGEQNEVVVVKIIKKEILRNRYIAITITRGDKYPFPTEVMGPDLQKRENPRPSDLIELDDQLFILIDTQKQRIYISNQKKKTEMRTWLKDKLDREVVIKSIISEQEFVNRIETIKSISFSVVPNLFNSPGQDILSSNLVGDIFGFGAEKAKIELYYNNSRISDAIKAKINTMLQRENEFSDITVIGRSDEDMESIFNLEGVTNKVQIEVETVLNSELVEPILVFNQLLIEVEGL